MAKLIIHQDKIENKEEFIKVCPFSAMEVKDVIIEISSACKMCKICVKSGGGAVSYTEEKQAEIDKSKWSGICVYVDHTGGSIHPVTYELIGKAESLAAKINQEVCCLLIGSGVSEAAKELLHYGTDKVYVYDKPRLENFSIEAYTAVFEDFIKKVKPGSVLVGATPVGRQLAPRVAARMRTGLTADCTVLDITEQTDLVQIRPAFGGNIMAQIVTPNHRPQMATVRYKIMNAPTRSESVSGEIIKCEIAEDRLVSGVEVLSVDEKEKVKTIEHADVLVVAGRGVKTKEDLKIVEELAELLGGEIAGTRPMIECGWIEPRRQIGLSGRTVRPKLIITCGVSGAVQFTAGMNNSDKIFAINKDKNAPIFAVANYGVVGDIYEIIPKLIQKIKSEAGGIYAL